ncbi:unannotated protein [freshwater metagenome]|uniref:Unannotated protein n=1 Tax=freshwater metagenome TaxID=449393 RepID=A0A6J6ZGN0_9ZZZZ
MLQQGLSEWLDSRIRLSVNIEEGRGKRLEKFGQRRDGIGPVDPGFRNLRPTQLADLPLLIGDPIKLVIMKGDEYSVGADMYIGL